MARIMVGSRNTRYIVTYLAWSSRGVVREIRLVIVVPFMARVGIIVCHLCTLPLGRADVGGGISHSIDALVLHCRVCCWYSKMSGEEGEVDSSHTKRAKSVESIMDTTKK